MGQLNIELFKKIRDRIAAIPESYNQNNWVSGNAAAPCGTAACIAGEAIICAAPSVEEGLKELHHYADNDTVPARAAELLGLDGSYWGEEQETAMFNASAKGWPQPYREMFMRALSTEERAAAAVAYLDHIIQTGKVLE